MLVAIDNLARINESYGFDVADEAIGEAAVAWSGGGHAQGRSRRLILRVAPAAPDGVPIIGR